MCMEHRENNVMLVACTLVRGGACVGNTGNLTGERWNLNRKHREYNVMYTAYILVRDGV